MDRRAEKRRRWFKVGVLALQMARPGSARVYRCPLCLQDFPAPDPQAVTFEHVPPESVGGRELVLTCALCNNESGTRLDKHLAIDGQLGRVVAGFETVRARLTAAGLTIN